MLFAAYRKEPGDTVALTEAYKTTMSDSRRSEFEKIADKTELTEAEVDTLRESVQKTLAQRVQPPVLIKTHNARVRHNGVPMIRRELTLGGIYILRNPLDVVDSVADHWGCSIDQAIQMMGNDRHTIGGRQDGMIKQYLQTWSKHVLSWTEQPAFPTLIIRYEDMKAAPEMTFRNVLTFLGWKIEAIRVTAAIDETQFEKLQAREAEDGYQERSDRSLSGRFFRKGKSGDWENVLTEEQIQRIVEDHGQVMRIDYGELKKRIRFRELLERIGWTSVEGRVDQLCGPCPLPECQSKVSSDCSKRKDRSFSIQTSKNVYLCFRCGSAGNALDFWQAYRATTLYEAAKELIQIHETSN